MREIKIKDSSNIKSLFYFDVLKQLYVFFQSSSLYVYDDIEVEEVNKLSAEQGSKYFYDEIREKKNYTKRY